MAPRRVNVVPHTHWDREWYSPFQKFRMRLVDMLDAFLPLLDADPSYSHFLLDGQMAVVDDYLEVRPEAAPTLQRLAREGRLAMGPWYSLPDEFLVSGETIIRNLQAGIARATEFGGAMDVGYLPDMFGHIAQMPQIVSQAGFGHAVVWRGVPGEIYSSGFWWTGLDGTTVRAEYLPDGYGNGSAIPDDAKALVRRVAAWEHELGDVLKGPILFMNGTDHQVPQPWLGRVVAEANGMQDDYEISITSLAEHLASAPTEGLPSWTGELRSGARANLLMGVASNRVDVKQAAARAERALERQAEPMSALFLPAEIWPGALLDLAWKFVLRNAAHDSICACSVDEVCDAVLHRYAEARQIADGLAERAAKYLANSLSVEGIAVINSSARTRGGVVEITLSDDAPIDGTQVLTSRPERSRGPQPVSASTMASTIGQIRDQRFSDNFFVNGIDVVEEGDDVEVVLWLAGARRAAEAVETGIAGVYEILNRRPDAHYRIRVELPPMQKVLARVESVPGFGWTTWDRSIVRDFDAVSVPNPRTMANGIVTVEVDEATGTFSVNGVAGMDRLVEDGDHGDTYNYNPPQQDIPVDKPASVDVRVLERGPVRGRIGITRTYVWPERVDEKGARVGERTTKVETTLELLAGDSTVRVTTSFDNQSRDHRVRAWFPLPTKATVSRAECAFGIVERGLEAEGGPNELGLATYPCRRFVSAGGVTIVHEGLLEYELVEGGSAIALTLLRATGMLSQGPMPYRPLPAGPLIPMEGPQMIGPLTVHYGVHVGDEDPYELADDFTLPLRVVHAPGTGDLPATGSALEVTGAQVSAVVRREAGLEVRVFNPSDAPTTVSIEGRTGWIVDLRGRPTDDFDGTTELRPWGIATVHLRDA
jgi:alpha-mannosidase